MVEDFIYPKVVPPNLNFIMQNFSGIPIKKLGDLYTARRFNPVRNQVYTTPDKVYIVLNSMLCVEITNYVKELHKLLSDNIDINLDLEFKANEVLACLRLNYNSSLEPLPYLINNSKLMYFLNLRNFESGPILITSSEIPKNMDKSVSSNIAYSSKIVYSKGESELTLNNLINTDIFKFTIPHFMHYLKSFYLPIII